MEIKVYGASDDLVEIDGDFSEEFSCYGQDEGMVLAFGDGTVLSVKYDDSGEWRLARLVAGSAKFDHAPSLGPDGDNHPGGETGYSDLVTLKGDLGWVLMAKNPVEGNFHRLTATKGSAK